MSERKKLSQKWIPGAVVQIDLGNNTYGYGRIIKFGLMAFYDTLTPTSCPPPIEEIINKPILFIIWVMKYAVTQDWLIIGKVALEGGLLIEPKFYKRDPTTGKIYIYMVDGNDLLVDWEECKNLECAVAWEPEHVVERLNDHFSGRPNYWVEYFRAENRSDFPDIVTFYKRYGYDYKFPVEEEERLK